MKLLKSLSESYNKAANKKYKRKMPKKKKRIMLVTGSLTFITGLYFISTIDTLFNLSTSFTVKKSNLPWDVLLEDVTSHPVGFVILIAISILMAKILTNPIAEKMSKRYGNIKVSKDKTEGPSERMGEDEKSHLFEFRDYYDPEGIIVAVDKDTGELLTIPWEYDNPDDALTNNNIVVFGDTGSRKTSGFLEGNILSCIKKGHTIALTDPKGEEYANTAPAAIAYGYKVNLLDFVGGHFQHSDGLDVLKIVRRSESPEEDAQIIVDQIVKNIGTPEENFWNDMNTNLLKLLVMTVSIAEGYIPRTSMDNAAKGRTFREMFALLSDDNLEKTLESLMVSEHNRRYLKDKYLAWSLHPQKESVRSGLQSKLAILNTENLLSVLSEDDVDFKKMNEEKSITYIIASDKDSTYKSVLSLVSAIMFREIMEFADEQSSKALQRPFYMFFEEFKNVGYIPDLAIKMAVIRSRMINMVFCFQNIGQIKDQYGSKRDGKYEWQTILSACALQVCCGVNDEDTAKYFSDRSGDMSVINTTSSQNVSALVPDALKWSPVEGRREQQKTRKTYLASEIAAMKKSEILISPAKHNSTIENKYYCKHHPLAQYKAVDESGNPITLSPDDHIPKWRERKLRNEALNAVGTDEGVYIPKITVRKFEGSHKKESENKKSTLGILCDTFINFREAIYEEEESEKRPKQRAVSYGDFVKSDKTITEKSEAKRTEAKEAAPPEFQAETPQVEVRENDLTSYYEDGLF